MRLVLIRHGEAESLQTSDAERALTERGASQARLTGQWLVDIINGSHALRVLASPYRRAQQTAAVVAGLLGQSIVTIEAIAPDADPRQAAVALEASASGAEWTVVVSHMPLVASLAQWLEHGVVAGSQGFSLAEARVLEMELWGAAQARLRECFVPGL